MNGEKILNKRRGCIVLFPSFIIILGMAFLNSDLSHITKLDLKKVSIGTLILGIPILFLLQGYLIHKNSMSLVVPLVISLISFIVAALVFLNTSALGYGIFYLVFGVSGYFLSKFFNL